MPRMESRTHLNGNS